MTERAALREKLHIKPDDLEAVSGVLSSPDNHLVGGLLDLVEKYGGVDAINRQADEAGRLETRIARLMHKLGIRNEFKVSVFMGVDNPWSVLWLLMGARLLAGDDGSTSLAGLNLSNSVEVDTLLADAEVRHALGFDEGVRFEHHVTETFKSIVRQPYDRRADVVTAAATVPNISAKHEGGDPAVEVTREHPSDILDYFISKDQVVADGLKPLLEQNYLDKHAALNETAAALTRAGIGVKPAALLHAATDSTAGVAV